MIGSLRINKARAAGQPTDEYLARLVKLVPSEVLAIYAAGTELAKTWLGVWAFVCLVLVAVVRAFASSQGGKPIQWKAVAVSLVSFIIWIYATGGQFFSWSLLIPGVASIAVIVWTFLVPYIYKGD